MSLNSDEVVSTVDAWYKAAFNLRKTMDQFPIQLAMQAFEISLEAPLLEALPGGA